MTCDEARDLAWLAEDGEPIPSGAARHLADCPACRAVQADRRRVIDACRPSGEGVLPALLRERILCAALARPGRVRRGRWAAAAAAAAAILVALAWPGRGLEAPRGTTTAPDAYAFDDACESLAGRLGDLEGAMIRDAGGCATGSSLDLGDILRRIEALEKALETDPPGSNKEPGQGAVPAGLTERTC
jgi:hypothetical protein